MQKSYSLRATASIVTLNDIQSNITLIEDVNCRLYRKYQILTHYNSVASRLYLLRVRLELVSIFLHTSAVRTHSHLLIFR